MSDETKSEEQRSSLTLYTSVLLAAWTAIAVGLATWSYLEEQATMRDVVRAEARASFAKDQAFRFWAASHGGVYVVVDEKTPPSPYLDHIPERDIETPSGRKLTLMNPAYALRQVMDEYSDLYGVHGHITSLNPLRPENGPDDWERAALESFEQGKEEAFEVTEFHGEPHLRLMRPMMTKELCLKCHGDQGYKVGDVRGGVGVAVPMGPAMAAAMSDWIQHAIMVGLLWGLGTVGIGVGARRVAGAARRQRVAERERTKLLKTLEAKNSELEQFAYTVSHDLKAPLITIRSYAQVVKEDLGDENHETVDTDLARIENAAKTMAVLLDDVLELSRSGRFVNSPKDVSLVDLTHEALSLAMTNSEKAGIQIEISPDLPVVLGDYSRLLQMMQNLVNNAAKYMGGQPEPRIEIGVRRDEGVEVCFVRDNGIGIEPAYREKVFGLFDQLDPSHEGTGVGLALVKRIIEVHGGRVWIESEGVGHGVTVCFTLPISQELASNGG